MSSAEIGAPVTDAEVRRLFADFAFLQQYRALILAVSGGPDSTALMVLAARWRKTLKHRVKLIAVTVDHGLRPGAKQEAQAVKKLARSLRIEHHTARTRSDACRGRVQADSALHPNGKRRFGEHALHEDERGLLADDPARLLSFDDEPVRARLDGIARLFHGSHLHQQRATEMCGRALEHRRRQHEHARFGRQYQLPETGMFGYAHAEGADASAHEQIERFTRDPRVMP